MFGIKDLFTTINLLGGVVAICLCIDGQPFYAGISVMLGYLCGDTMDGYVARKLGTSNAFGAEYDTISDHLSHIVAPAAIVYTVYKDVHLLPEPWMNHVLAIALAASILISVSVRHARNIVAPVNVKGVWVGLPRSVMGFWAIGYADAALAPYAPGGWWFGVVLIPLMSYATLTYWPFPSHRLSNHRLGYYVGAVIFMAGTVLMLLFKREFFFDVVFFYMAVYSATAWMLMNKAQRAEYWKVVATARAQYRAAAS